MPEPKQLPPTLSSEAAPEPFPTRCESSAGDAPPSVAADSNASSLGTRSDAVLRLRDTQGGLGGLPAPNVPGDRIGPYEVCGEVGRGGMGAVLRGRDPNLGRELALKVLLAEHAGRPEVVQRFVEEAQIGGQLQHPGVVPVHDLGRCDDGRPFFTMKLVKGQTLAKLLKDHPDPAPERPRFLQIFEQVCQTVAYAHSKGVIHRDLKPANIMVGAFGEVQVMDWGLAKVLTSGGEVQASVPHAEELPASIIQTERSATASHTQAGSLMGTPAYMPPEQALGEVDRLDERSDVFSLGAVLCEVLTGRPPYLGSLDSVLRQARRGDLAAAFAALDGCGADAELVALARRCLAAELADRPRDAGEVAAAVAAYRAGVDERVRRAEVERAAAQARAEEARVTAAAERRARRLTLGLATTALLLVVAGGGGVWLLQQQHAASVARRQGIDEKTRLTMDRARSLLAAAWEAHDARKLAEARAEADKASELALSGDASAAVTREANELNEEVKERIAQAEKNRALQTALLDITQTAETRTYVRTSTGEMMKVTEPPIEERYAAAFRRWGIKDIDAEPLASLVARFQAQPPPVMDEIVAGLDAWMLYRRRQKQAEPRWRKLLDVANRLDRDERRQELRRLQTTTLGKAESLRLRKLAGEVDLLRESVRGVWTLARTLRRAGDHRSAEELLRRALAIRPGEVVLLTALGTVLERQRPPRLGEAIECYRAARAVRPSLGITLAAALRKTNRAGEAVAILEDLRRAQPENPEIHTRLGLALSEQQQHGKAEAAHRQAIALQPAYAWAHSNLGVSLFAQGRLEEAVAAFRKVIALKPGDAFAHVRLSIALNRQKKLDEAVTSANKAITLRPNEALAHNALGMALHEQGKLDEAVKVLRKAVALKRDNAVGYSALGQILLKQGKVDEAIATYRKVIEVQPDNLLGYTGLGSALTRQKKPGEALAAYRMAVKVAPTSALAHVLLGNALRDQNKLDEAVSVFRKAVALKPDFAMAYQNLGLALRALKRPDEAADAFRRRVELLPGDPDAHNDLGTALHDQKQFAEAAAAFRRATVLKEDFALAYNNLGLALAAQRKFAAAEVAHSKAIALRPTDASAHFNLGIALANQGKFAQAAAAYREAIALRPTDASAQVNLGLALAKLGQSEQAVAAYRAAIKLTPANFEAYQYLGEALYEQQKLDEAVAAWRKAVALRPDSSTYYNLGVALFEQKKFPEAEAADRKAIDLKHDFPEAHHNLGNAFREQQKFDEAVTAYRQALQLYGKALAAEPKPAPEVAAQHRYNAACASVLLATVKGGRKTGDLDDRERARLRRQALAWLRTILAAYAARADKGDRASRQTVQKELAHWVKDAELASVREEKSLAVLPEAERATWQQLWADLAAVRKKAASKE